MKDLIRTLNTARSMPPKLLAEMLARHAKHKVRRYYIRLFPVKLSDNRFFRLTANFNLEKTPPFFFHLGDKDIIVETIKEEYAASIEQQTINDADKICTHIFDLLGSGKQELGKEICWHLDFKTGFRWNPKTYYLGTRKHVTLDDASDVKVLWELSRCQHFVTLGKAYWYIKQCKIDGEKYVREFVNQITDWIDANPVELGVNWACTMDVAIRAVNWIWGYHFFLWFPKSHKRVQTKIL